MVSGGRPDVRGAGEHLSSGDRKVYVVFNPASGRGRGGRRIAGYLELLSRHVPGFSHGITNGPGHEAELTTRALEQGYDTIVAAGGDGTWSHVADRILDLGRGDVRFGVLPSGTGNDFGRGLGLSFRDPEAAVRSIADGRTVRVDAGRVVTPSRASAPGRDGQASRPAGVPGPAPRADAAASRPRHFLNLVGFGFDIAVIDAAARARLLRGELLYKITALQQLFRFPGVDVRLEGDGGPVRSGPHLMLTVSNGRYFGGGFPIAPRADVRDGLLHACAIGDASPATRMRLFGLAGKGRHEESDRVEVRSGKRFAVSFEAPPRFEIDGDVYVASDPCVRAEILPGALEVIVARPPEKGP